MRYHSRGSVSVQGVLLAILCVSLSTSCASRGKPLIASDGKTQYAVVLPDKATEPEKFAVRELTNFLNRVTGASFPVAAESAQPEEGGRIYVGWTKYAAANGIDAAKLGEEEWIIQSMGKNLILTGGYPRGTIYAVYEFLEREVGCHWLDRDTEVIPSKPTLELTALNIRGKPAIWQRYIYTAFQKVAPTDDMMERQKMFWIRNKCNCQVLASGWPTVGGVYKVNGSGGTGHTFSNYVNGADWFESHPEYFSLNDKGKRLPAMSAVGPGQLCMTHPDVRRLTLESLRKFIAKDREEAAQKGCPPPKIYDISQNDGGSLCVCRTCQAIIKQERTYSGPLIDFINDIAENIEKEYPDILIQTFAYNLTLRPPKTLKPRHNVIVRWCDPYYSSDLVRPLSHPYNSSNYKIIQGWGEIASHLAVWDYWIPYSLYWFPTPYCMIQSIGPDMKLFADLHTETLFCESEEEKIKYGRGCHEVGENFTDLKYWLGYQLMVNPYQPDEPLIQTFMDGYYGAAGPAMNEYLKYLQERIDKEAEKMQVRKEPQNLKYLDMNFFVKAEKIFDEAEKAITPESLDALHVQKERLIVDGALLFLWPWLERKLPAEAAMPFDHETVIRRYETNWRAQSKAFYSEEAQAWREVYISKLAAMFRDPKLPGQFRNLPSRDVADFNWTTFRPNDNAESKTFLDDPEAVGGHAVSANAQGKVQGKSSKKTAKHEKPLVFGVTDGATITLEPEDIPQDGKYHLFKIGRVNVKKGTTVWAHADQQLKVIVDRVVVEDAKDIAANDWDVYISLKFKGPAYVKGATEANDIWMDRVLLVKPQKSGKDDAAE